MTETLFGCCNPFEAVQVALQDCVTIVSEEVWLLILPRCLLTGREAVVVFSEGSGA